MLYFDNAATSYPKPIEVRRAVENSLIYYGANPGRSGYPMSMDTSREVYTCREKIAEFFGLQNPENLLFTKSCTEAINIVLQSVAKNGHCIISDIEHNAVLRPLHKMKCEGKTEYSVAKVFEHDDEKTLQSFAEAFKPNTKLVAVSGASNVFGIKLPVKELAKMAHEHGALFMLDAAQTAGSVDYKMERDGIDFICAPAHKGLLGIMGLGILGTRCPEEIEPLIYGGTGNYSLDFDQPETLPERFESGTLGVPAICALSEGVEKIKAMGEINIEKHEIELAKYFYEEIEKLNNVKLYTLTPNNEHNSAAISFVLGDLTGEETSMLLSERGVASRGGFHCSALAHRKFKTDNRGTCRISFGEANTFDETQKLIKIIYSLDKNI